MERKRYENSYCPQCLGLYQVTGQISVCYICHVPLVMMVPESSPQPDTDDFSDVPAKIVSGK